MRAWSGGSHNERDKYSDKAGQFLRNFIIFDYIGFTICKAHG